MDRKRWHTPPALWARLKPLARQMRHAQTPAEQKLWHGLRNYGIAGVRFRRQHGIDRFIVDFYCAAARLVIEVDGEIHDYTPEEDRIRQEFLESAGFHVIRFRNHEVLDDTPTVLEKIGATLFELGVKNPL